MPRNTASRRSFLGRAAALSAAVLAGLAARWSAGQAPASQPAKPDAPKLTITTRALRRCDVVVVGGRIDNQTVKQLHDALTAITEAGRYKIVLNMKDVSYISSAGMGQLIDTQTICKRHRSELVLAEVPPRIREVIELAGLTPLFKTFDTEIEAVGSF